MESTVKSRVRPRSIFRFIRKLLSVLLLAAVAFCAGFWVCLAEPWEAETVLPEIVPDAVLEEEKFTLSISTVEEVLRPAADLITTKYYYTDADVYEHYKEIWGHKLPLTTDKVVFTYDGYLGVGIDMKELSFEIDDENRVITIVLPELGIRSNEIDPASFSFPYMSDSIFNDTRMDNYMELIDKLKKEKAREFMGNDELLQEALDNTRQVLRSFLTGSEFTRDYQVVFK